MQIIKSIFRECENETKKVTKNTLRAVIKNGDRIFMLKHKGYSDYTFPGVEMTSRRGLEEKIANTFTGIVGAEKFSSIEPLGVIEEYRPLKESEGAFNQVSFYFLCVADNVKPELIESYRIMPDFEPIWVTLDQALELNDVRNVINIDDSTARLRDFYMLEYIKGAQE